jgi:hypothetical protein
MTSAPAFVPVVDCHQVLLLAQHAQQLPGDEQSQLFEDLERDPDVGPVVVSEVRTYLEHHQA